MPKKNKVDPLPDTLSGLIRVALKDLAKAERTPGYVIDMHDWHSPTQNGKNCSVCFAGSVMAMSLKASPLSDVSPDDWWNGITGKLEAINSLREGDITSALSYIGLDWGSPQHSAGMEFERDHADVCCIPDYGKSASQRKKFHDAQKKLATALAKIGL